MKFEVLKQNHLKRNILIGVVVVVIISACILTFTRARYRTTQSVKIVEGYIEWSPYDFHILAMYQENESGTYDEVDIMPGDGYIINQTESYCIVNGETDTNAILRTIDGNHSFANLQKGSKCYLYFDRDSGPLLTDAILEGKSIQTTSDFSTALTSDTSGIIYITSDNNGIGYYFAGDTEENWVRFGGYYWRIIRINGDGTVRMIYAGEDSGRITDANRTGTTTQISLDGSTTGYAFNTERDRSYYVGLEYSSAQHGSTSSSDILDTMNTWYTINISSSNRAHVDTSAWFCSDRDMASGYGWSSQPSNTIYYATYDRLVTNKTPTLQCNTSSDRLTTPNGVGLITADEVAMAGGVWNISNQSYYLYTGQDYWTMSPYFFRVSINNSSFVFRVTSSGSLNDSSVNSAYGVRPVINLKADTTVTGDGTSSNPFVVS